MYSYKSRIRYSEVDSEGKITLRAILDYLQDCTIFQSEDRKVGIEYLKEIKMAWVLNYWQIDIFSYPKIGEYIEICTLPYDFKIFTGYRNFFIRNDKGEIIVKANSIWTLIDLEKNKPAKMPPEMLKAYVVEPKIDMEYLDRKIGNLSGKEIKLEPIVVKKHHIDTNHHVNNAEYVSIGMNYLDEDSGIRRLRVEYKGQARLGDEMIPYISKDENSTKVSLQNEDGQIYANILFDKG